MKKVLLTTLITLSFVSASVAQLTSGQVSYEINISSDSEQGAQIASMMDGATMKIYFDKSGTRTEFDMGFMMSMTTILNNDTEEIVMLMGGMMGNKAIKSSVTEMKVEEDKGNEDLSIELKDEKKTIAGYKCKKAILKNKNGATDIIYWYTEDIEMNTTAQNNMNSLVPGFAMEYEVKSNGMNKKITVSEVIKKLDKNPSELFSTKVPDGYEEMSMDDLKKMGLGN